MKNMRRIFTLVLALVMMMSLAVTGFADGTEPTYSINVTNNSAEKEHFYEVYQIFKGSVKESEISGVDSNDVLSDVEWGSGVDASKYDAIKAALTNSAQSPLFAAAYTSVATDSIDGPIFAEMNDASKIAFVLAKNKTNFELVKEFSKVICANLSDTYVTLDLVDKVERKDFTKYTKDGFEGGYYLIKDKDGSLEDSNETYTSNMLQVVGTTNINAKGGTVTVDKAISVGGALKEAHDFNIGDTVDYVIDGSMPYNYNRFATFKYTFGDTMSKGLTYVEGSLKVYLLNSGSKDLLAPTTMVDGEERTNWTLTVTGNADGSTGLVVDFPNMKAITDRTIDAQTHVIVEYQAIVNKHADIGTSNPNTVDLTFNNNPYKDTEYGVTPPDVVHAFVFQLDINKIDGANSKVTLEGAEFVLWRQHMGQNQYAIVEDGKLAGWAMYKDEADRTAKGGLDTDPVATVLRTGTDGKIAVAGLKSDVYYLQETKAPEGYNLDPNVIEVDIDAVVSEDAAGNGKVDSLTITINGGTAHNGADGVVNMTVVNNQGSTLPETGGIGTTMFYILGGLMVLGAVAMLVTKKRIAAEV